jgi:RNA polymerase sigma-70 factor (ECF subfamily)
MLKFKEGDESAFEELVERNIGKVHGLVYRFLGEASAIEDITQDVFLRVYRNAGRYEPTAKFSTWLYRIVANLCFNVIRSRKKKRRISLETIGDDEKRMDLPDNRQAPPEKQLDSSVLARKVNDALESLPENQRLAIILNKYEDKNYKEIAGILDISTLAVKSLLSRARQNLRQMLSPYLYMD